MFKTFADTAPQSPSADTLEGNSPTVGWIVVNGGVFPLEFKLEGYSSDPFVINPGEVMKIPVPISDATISAIDGTSSYRVISVGLASLFQEFALELPRVVVIP